MRNVSLIVGGNNSRRIDSGLIKRGNRTPRQLIIDPRRRGEEKRGTCECEAAAERDTTISRASRVDLRGYALIIARGHASIVII